MEREYVRIENQGTVNQSMIGWTLEDFVGHVYDFPIDFILHEGDDVQVWTGSGTNTIDHLFWARPSAVWGNEEDAAYLRDPRGVIIDSFSWTSDP